MWSLPFCLIDAQGKAYISNGFWEQYKMTFKISLDGAATSLSKIAIM